MIPLATPQAGEILNLSQIVRTRTVSSPNDDPASGEIEVYLSDGTKRVYNGQAALVVMAELGFALDTYRKFQAAAQSNIVAADGNTPARIIL